MASARLPHIQESPRHDPRVSPGRRCPRGRGPARGSSPDRRGGTAPGGWIYAADRLVAHPARQDGAPRCGSDAAAPPRRRQHRPVQPVCRRPDRLRQIPASDTGMRADVSSALGYLESPGTTSPARGVLGLYGEQDLLPSPGELDEWEQQLAAPVAAELVRYPDAGHAFDVEEA